MPSETCKDAVKMLHRLRLFELGDDPGIAAMGGDAIAHQGDILSGAHKGNGDGVDSVVQRKFKIERVLLSERGRANQNAGKIDAFAFAEHAAVDDVADNVAAGISWTRSSMSPSESRMREPCSTFSASVLNVVPTRDAVPGTSRGVMVSRCPALSKTG